MKSKHSKLVLGTVLLALTAMLTVLPATQARSAPGFPDIVGTYYVGFPVQYIDVSRDGRYAIVSGETYDTSVLLHFDGSEVSMIWESEYGGPAAISYNGRYVVLGSGSTLVFFKGIGGSGTPLWTRDLDGTILDVAMSASGSYVAALTGKSIYMFNMWGRLMWKYTYSPSTEGGVGYIDMDFFGITIAVSTYKASGADGTGHLIALFGYGGRMFWSYLLEGGSDSVGQIAIDNYGRLIAATHITYNGEEDVSTLYTFNRGGYENSVEIIGNVNAVDVSDNSYIIVGGNIGINYGTILFTRNLDEVMTYGITVRYEGPAQVSISGNARYMLFQALVLTLLSRNGDPIWEIGWVSASKIAPIGTLSVFSVSVEDEGFVVAWARSRGVSGGPM